MIVALNNKSNLTKDEFLKYQFELNHVETNHLMILCPSIVHIPLYTESKIKLGAQNVSCTAKGAHTGEIYADQLVSYGVEYCIIGHSERRQDQKESDEEIHEKVERLFEAGITPILCCGETKEEREEGREKEVIGRELDIALNGISEEDKARVIIAYEPIWSIGTGLIPTNDQIIDIIDFIKSKYNCKVLYGGSANDNNIDELKQCACIDGYLLGGLSLKPDNLKVFVNKL